MNDLSPPSLDPAQGADVLATIRRLLAQDAASPEDAATREGALRRRLIGTRRRGGMARRSEDDVLPVDAAAGQQVAALPQPLRLADDQRIAASVVGQANQVADEDISLVAGAPAETAPAVATVSEPELYAEPVAPEEEPLPLSMSAVPSLVVPQSAQLLCDAEPFLHDVPTCDAPAPASWSYAASRAPNRLHELLTFQAWIAEPDPEAEATASAIEPDGPTIASDPQSVAATETLAPAPASPEIPAQDPALPGALIRETLLQELAGETGAQLGAAIQQLARDAVARALGDLARAMTVPEAPGLLPDR